MTTLAQRLGIDLPIIQAPMAGVQDETLALAVAAAGGLGSMPCALLDTARLDAALARFASQPRAINLNFFCHAMREPDAAQAARWHAALAPYYREAGIDPPAPTTAGARRPIDADVVAVLARHRPRVVSFHFGLPSPTLLTTIKAWGAIVLASATTDAEGAWLVAHGADVVIAQGIEAGGHRGHFLSDDPSLQRPTRDLVTALVATLDAPVVAAGGIADRDDVEAMLAAGAAAVQVGTAYLACPEATTSAVHRAALARRDHDTAVTNLFSGRPARGIVNRLMRERGAMSDAAPDFPWASAALAPLRAHAEAWGRDDFSPLWSGTTPPRFGDASAADITRALAGIVD